MKLWKSVVGKLWMTIIVLVAVVLLINGLFMGQFLDTNFANSKDQEISLQKLAAKVSDDLNNHQQDVNYLNAVNELLAAQDAALVVLDAQLEEAFANPGAEALPKFKAIDIFSQDELVGVTAGGGTSKRIFVDPGSGKRFMAVAVPHPNKLTGKPGGLVMIYQSQITLSNTQAYFRNLFFIAAVVGFLLTTLFAFFLSTKITQPLLQMKKAAGYITLGEYRTRVPVNSSDEIGELAQSFNHMAGQLDETIHALNHEKEHLSSVLRSMTDAVVTLDADGVVILTNPPGEKLVREWLDLEWSDTDQDPEQEQGDSEDRKGTDPEARPDEANPPHVPVPLQALFDSVVQDSREATSTIHVRNSVYSVVMAPLNAGESLRGAVAVLRDVSEEHRLDKLRKDFVANVSHELRTPLSMLQGYSEALLDDIVSTPEERHDVAQVIHDESLRMGRLVQDLLDLARMEAGHLEMHFGPVDLNALVMRVQRKFSALCREKGLTLNVEFEPDSIRLDHADEDRLEQVLTNLLDNAIRHSSPGGELAIRARTVTTGGNPAVRLQVSDQGQGIPKEDVPYIFERFYKADKARTRGSSSSGGTGLGLAIVKNLVEAHQGTITAESELGLGTTFSITIPNHST
ncbi:ATP-binding protein [Paenibacillus sp. HJGM_3]|uniref:ATP-binding protein n=1 Tax=Paenibacillus sp. HJGM_3 TaxID=3379816 RepID=UPI00385C567E